MIRRRALSATAALAGLLVSWTAGPGAALCMPDDGVQAEAAHAAHSHAGHHGMHAGHPAPAPEPGDDRGAPSAPECPLMAVGAGSCLGAATPAAAARPRQLATMDGQDYPTPAAVRDQLLAASLFRPPRGLTGAVSFLAPGRSGPARLRSRHRSGDPTMKKTFGALALALGVVLCAPAARAQATHAHHGGHGDNGAPAAHVLHGSLMHRQELGLSADQASRLAAIQEELKAAHREHCGQLRGASADAGRRQAMHAQMRTAMQRAHEQAAAALTAEQRARLDALHVAHHGAAQHAAMQHGGAHAHGQHASAQAGQAHAGHAQHHASAQGSQAHVGHGEQCKGDDCCGGAGCCEDGTCDEAACEECCEVCCEGMKHDGGHAGHAEGHSHR